MIKRKRQNTDVFSIGSQPRELSVKQKQISAFVGNMMKPVFGQPFDILKTRLQTNILCYNSNSPFFIFKSILSHEGILNGLKSGFFPSLLSQAVFGVGYWPVYFFLEQKMRKLYLNIFNRIPGMASVVVPAVFGSWLAGTLVSSPFTYLKVKYQTGAKGSFLDLIKKENLGLRDFYRGYWANSLMSINQMVSFLTYKSFRDFFNKFSKNSAFITVSASFSSVLFCSSMLYWSEKYVSCMRVSGKNFDRKKFFSSGFREIHKGFLTNAVGGLVMNVSAMALIELCMAYFEKKNSAYKRLENEEEKKEIQSVYVS